MWLTTIVTGWVFVGSRASGNRFRPGSHHPMLATSRWTAITPRIGEHVMSDANDGEPFTFDGNHYSLHSSGPAVLRTTQAGDLRNSDLSALTNATDAEAEAEVTDVNYNRAVSLDPRLTSQNQTLNVNLLRNTMPERIGVRPFDQHSFIAPVLISLVDQEPTPTTNSVINVEPE
ncbi:unnamed protein product [Echinostoma caproni]|uniref:Signal peptide protein n=1 Tax=Echinostoma caproni TaxID=27848 RepID=A0A183AL30_9TREM|nr:unnamed protein product [Echinostoma caproni]